MANACNHADVESGLCFQPIKMETSPGKVEMAILHVAELENSAQADQRWVAMLQRSPLHTLLFSNNGRLVTGNKAAISKLHRLMEGINAHAHQHITMRIPFVYFGR